MKSKQIGAVFLFNLILLLFSGCSSPFANKDISSATEVLNSENAADIIHKFLKGNYEYTISYYNIPPNESEQLIYSYNGQLISSPYQQYEKLTDSSPEDTTIQEIFCYDKNGDVYADVLYCDGISHGQRITDQPYTKPNFYYVQDGLSFTFDRNEELNNQNTSVYSSTFQQTTFDPEDTQAAGLPYNVNLEFFVDTKSKRVSRVVFDLTECAKVSEIAREMQKGATMEEAEKIIEEEGGVDGLKGVVDIFNFGGDFEIKIPEANNQNLNTEKN